MKNFILSFAAAILTLPVQPLSADNGAAPAGPMGALVSFFPLIAFALIFYFLLFRPQQKANQQRKKMLESVKKGDRVLTSGGLYGSVLNVRGDILDLKLADNLKVEVNRNFIARVLPQGSVEKTPAGA